MHFRPESVLPCVFSVLLPRFCNVFSKLLMGVLTICSTVSVCFAADSNKPPWLPQIDEIVMIETWREPDGSNENQVRKNIGAIQKKFAGWINAFVKRHRIQNHIPEPFSWKSDDDKYWVFGWRVGDGKRKISLLTHLDTVSPGSSDWKPFNPRQETRSYNGKDTTFLVGRGVIDNKGPAVVTLNALLEAIAQLDSQPDALEEVTFELLFDTSEETNFSTTRFYDANADALPDLGIVYDAFWCIRAEKGIERPVFGIPLVANPTEGLWVADFYSATGPTNQIPGSATARITGASSNALDAFAAQVPKLYESFGFDDPHYKRAKLAVTRSDSGDVILQTAVAGAQHGSAPNENRKNGANPLVSLGVFLDGLADDSKLGKNHYTQIADFMTWAWGTRVFGENQPDLLYRYDTIFKEGNGTTYALTQLQIPHEGNLAGMVKLSMDIRYAIGHHAKGWDGSQGLIEGDSLFQSAFQQLVERYREGTNATVMFIPKTVAGPDIRNPQNKYLSLVNDAYEGVLGEDCPMRAIGGGTDAKGNLQLVAAGALFTGSLGPPINFHGRNEGAPIEDLIKGKKILKALLLNEAAAN